MSGFEFQAPYYLLAPLFLLLINLAVKKLNLFNTRKLHLNNHVSIFMPTSMARIKKLESKNQKIANIYSWFLIVLMSVALAQPVIKEKLSIKSNKTRDIFFVVDVSVGMAIDDYNLDNKKIDRLTFVKILLQDFVNQLNNNRIGTIVYADEAYILTPLTADKNLVKFNINRIRPALAGRRNNLANALATLMSEITRSTSKPTIVVLSQGANLENPENLNSIIKAYSERNIKLHFIGLGAETTSNQSSRSKLIYEALDKKRLNHLSDITGGQFFWAGVSDELKTALNLIRKSETIQLPDREIFIIKNYYYWVLYLLLALMSLTKLTDLTRTAAQVFRS